MKRPKNALWFDECTVDLGYNVFKGTDYFVSL
jgi:hypothetical protein